MRDKNRKAFSPIAASPNIAASLASSPNSVASIANSRVAAVLLAAVLCLAAAQPFAALRAHWDEEQIVEIVAAVAMAGFLARWNGTMATPLEDEPREVAEKHLAPQGWTAGIHG